MMAVRIFATFISYLMVFQVIFALITSPMITLLLPIYVLFCTKYWFLTILYLTWMVYDRKTASRGARQKPWFRNWSWWSYYSEYFPVTLIKTDDLPADRNYIFALHPHGIMNLGAFGALATESCGFGRLFPGLKIYMCTLKAQFWFPFRRDYLLCLGAVDVSAESINYLLQNGTGGNIATIVVGGAREALNARPGRYDLVLKDRKGFVRLALRNGACLVPVMSFGEPDLYNQVDNPPGSKLRIFQEYVRERMGASPAVFYGRWPFLPFLCMPLQRPVNVVVGRPINVEKRPEPTDQEIDDLHKIYVNNLIRLFDEYKCRFGLSDDSSLIIY